MSTWETVKQLRDTFKNNPRNAETVDAMKGMLGLIPGGPGDVAAAGMAADDMRQGNYLSAGLNAVGILPYIPALGGVVKSSAADALTSVNQLRKAPKPKKATQTVSQLVDKIDTSALSESEKRMVETFGAKAEREAKAAAKLKRMEKSEAPAKVIKSTESTRQGAISPHYFRNLLESEGPEEVLRQANAGVHLKPSASGGFVGAPRTVASNRDLTAMRTNFDKQLDDAANAVAVAEADTPERIGTWYPRAKGGMAEINEPHQIERALDQHAAYSAGVSPEAEMQFALKHHTSRALGDPETAYTGTVARKLDKSVADDVPMELGPKTGMYRDKLDPEVGSNPLFGTNDFRHSQAFGYTDPAGNPWRAGASATMHPFMDAETALAVERANQLRIFGDNPVTGDAAQEMPWVLNKAEDYFGRAAGKLKPEKAVAKMKEELRKANNTMADYIPKHTVSLTAEQAPGVAGGHVPAYHSMTPEEKAAFSAERSWASPSPMPPTEGGTGEGLRDMIYRAMNLRQSPVKESTGAYTNSLGDLENNAMAISRPLVDMKKGAHQVEPRAFEALQAGEHFKGLSDAQEATAGHIMHTGNSVKGRTSALLESKNQPTAEQLAKIKSLLGDEGIAVTAGDRGISIMNLSDNPKLVHDMLKKHKSELDKIYKSTPVKAKSESFYNAALGKFDKDYNLQPTAPFSGEATVAMLRRFAQTNPEVARSLGESEEVRRNLLKKVDLDEALGGARQDLQNTRRMLALTNWPQAVEMLRKGATPAAAVGALGFSLNSLADDRSPYDQTQR